ncbi:unnamed protein product [Spirodela intermedia]|uniref:DEUBAD domain-containing protein n=1 Tax=Spirodela intermedia TaxID=51605 RepID=A0A7I8LJW4_SPIIN|nr:unnamed protein product [Spirodela intermedia]
MGIVKVNVRRKEGDHYVQQSSPIAAIHDHEHAERIIPERKHFDDSEVDFEVADVDCELIKIRDQICSVPYDLYDLANLKEVLSLETWNSCLSEEERFSLTAYLPNVDQETFWLTIRELLGGEDVFFGSPLDVFFQRLKGGLYSPRVSQSREALQFVHRCGHYHSLRLYHEKMAQTFISMQKAWRECLPSTTAEERIDIWNRQKAPAKPVYMVDLNALPADEEAPLAGDRNMSSPPLSKKTTSSADDRVIRDTQFSPAIYGGSAASFPRMKPKGVLKIRSASRISEPGTTNQSLPCDSWGKLRMQPKGVLKIRPRSDPLLKPWDPMPVESSGFPAFSFSPQQSVFDLTNICNESPLPYQRYKYGPFSESGELPLLVRESLNRDAGPFSDLPRRKLRKVGFHSEEEGHFFPLKNLRKSQVDPHKLDDIGDQWAMGLPLSSKEERTPMPSLASGTLQKISAVDTEDSEAFDRPEHRRRENSGKVPLKMPSDPPLTYQRKKGPSKHTVLKPLRYQPAGTADLKMGLAKGGDRNRMEETKSMKIKLKMWNAPDNQYKQGLLNSL